MPTFQRTTPLIESVERQISDALTRRPDDAPSSPYNRLAALVTARTMVPVDASPTYGLVDGADAYDARQETYNFLTCRFATRAAFADFTNNNTVELDRMTAFLRGV